MTSSRCGWSCAGPVLLGSFFKLPRRQAEPQLGHFVQFGFHLRRSSLCHVEAVLSEFSILGRTERHSVTDT
jgi:hypothetical protein